MTKEFPYKPLANPEGVYFPKPGDHYFSRRAKRERLRRQQLREAWQQEQQEQSEGKTDKPS